MEILLINCHVLSGGNHNPMLVERVNHYISKGLKIMSNERKSIQVALKTILLLIYAWNSCPVPGTYILRSLVAVGQEFAFPIDYSSGKHWELTSSPSTVITYSNKLAMRLTACRAIAELLMQEQRLFHREFMNATQHQTQGFTELAISFLHDAQSGPFCAKNRWTSCNTHSQDLGE
jgi:hypothetical protein